MVRKSASPQLRKLSRPREAGQKQVFTCLRPRIANSKILGTAWLALGGIFLALALLAFVSVVLGDDPDAQAFEAGDKWWIVVLVLLGVGAILMVPGLALLRRDPVARSLLIISSLVLLIPSAVGAVAAGGAVGLVGALLVVGAQPMAHVVKRWQEGVRELYGEGGRLSILC